MILEAASEDAGGHLSKEVLRCLETAVGSLDGRDLRPDLAKKGVVRDLQHGGSS